MNGKGLKILRISREMTQKQLADIAQINVRSLQAYEEGIRGLEKMSLGSAYRLAKALDLKLEDLVEQEVSI